MRQMPRKADLRALKLRSVQEIIAAMRRYDATDGMDYTLSDHPKPANEYHLKTGQRE
jgi:hypothetical protein